MQLKVNLPNPYELDAEQFFAQMRISLKAAEKTYQESIKNLPEENKKDVSFYFSLPEFGEELEEIDENCDKRQEIQLIISY